MNSSSTEIVLVSKGERSSDYSSFAESLPAGECLWAVYDFEFQTEEGGKRDKLVFFSWCVISIAEPIGL